MTNDHRQSDRARLAALGIMTAGTAALSVIGFRAMHAPEGVPAVDGLAEPGPGEGGEWPFVSIVVPARNEERNLPRLLPSLLSQRYPNYEVIVVDDQSTDRTPEILAEWAARDSRLMVVRGRPLPEDAGWRGKPYAVHQGVSRAEGSGTGDRGPAIGGSPTPASWLLFTDADTVHEPLALSSTVAFAVKRHIDMLSILPGSELKTPAERIVMPVAFMGIMNLYPPSRVNNPNDSAALANGQFILIRREVYDAVGGIGSVRDQIVEDLEFARVVKGAGYRLFLADGRQLVSVRMYTSLAEIWEGWTKNTVLSFRGKPGLAIFAVHGLAVLNLVPPLVVRWAVRAWNRSARTGRPADRLAAAWMTALGAWYVLMPLIYRRRVDKVMGLAPGWALTQPIGLLVMTAIMLNSLVRILTGRGVTWKGRRYEGRSE